MTAMKLVILLLALACRFDVKVAQVQSDNEDNVECSYDTTFCSCSVEKEICNFQLTIRETQTFTRYVVDGVRGTAGKVWYINQTTGDLEPIPREMDSNERCLNESSQTCTDAITVDGKTFRTIITINEQFPGPTLRVHHNQIVSVELTNLLASEEVTIHWHGMHQVNTPWMDGVHHVSQCGIAPGATFRYIFRAWPAGTYWYHSHTGAQRTDGLFGALIVMESSDVIDAVRSKISPFTDDPDSHTMTLLDWQERSSVNLFTQIHSGIRYFNEFSAPDPMNNNTRLAPSTTSLDGGEVGEVTFWSGLINGKGRHPETPYIKTRLSVFVVDFSKTYRFRVIGAQSLYAFRLSVDGHRMKVIATDGHFVNPAIVDFLIVHSGERYDFLLKTKPKPPTNSSDIIENFMIRGETLEKDYTNHTAEAILHYGSSPQPSSPGYEEIATNSLNKSEECMTTMNCTALNCPFKDYPSSYGIQCIHIDTLSLLNVVSEDDNLPDYVADQTIFLNFGEVGALETSSINSRNFKRPSSPLSLLNKEEFVAIESKEQCDEANKLECDTDSDKLLPEDCSCVHMINVPYNQSVQIVISATGPNPSNLMSFPSAHPVHLHGHSFHVVKIGFGDYDENGMLVKASTDIGCEGTNTCVSGFWKSNPLEGKKGKIPKDAPLKDTVLLPAGGYVVVYIKSNNPGFWFLHCHIEVHQLEGMSVVINEGSDQHNPPPDGMHQCGNFTWSVDEFKSKEVRLALTPSPSPGKTPDTTSPATLPSPSENGLQELDYIFISIGVVAAIELLVILILIIVICAVCKKKNPSSETYELQSHTQDDVQLLDQT